METGWEAVEWIHMAQDVDKWWAPVNTLLIRFYKRKNLNCLRTYWLVRKSFALYS
jgi:hypothetical protein